jgi:hypothetical protein
MQDRAHAALVAGGIGQVGVGRLGRWTPVPGILEGQQLGIGGIARLVAEDDVVVAIRVEGRVEVDQVDGGIGQVATQDIEVVAVVEDIGGEVSHRSLVPQERHDPADPVHHPDA